MSITAGLHSRELRPQTLWRRGSIDPWRALPALQGAALALSATCLLVLVFAASVLSATRSLGYAGSTTRLVAAASGTTADQLDFANALTRFVDDNQLSIAYSPSSGSGTVTIDDRPRRFRSGDGEPLAQDLQAVEPHPAALLSTAVPGSEDVRSALLPSGVELAGTFRPDVQFDGEYPLLLMDASAAKYESGIYIVAGMGRGERAKLVSLFAEHQMTIVHLTIQPQARLWTTLAPPYGPVVIAFGMLSILSAYLVAHMDVSISRERLVIAAAIGAVPSELRLLVLRRLTPFAIAGTALGLVVGLIVALVTRNLLHLDTMTIAAAVASGALLCAVVWSLILFVVSWVEARQVFRAVSR